MFGNKKAYKRGYDAAIREWEIPQPFRDDGFWGIKKPSYKQVVENNKELHEARREVLADLDRFQRSRATAALELMEDGFHLIVDNVDDLNNIIANSTDVRVQHPCEATTVTGETVTFYPSDVKSIRVLGGSK